MTDENCELLTEALRMCAQELATWREWGYTKRTPPDASDADVDDVVEEMLDKARGFAGETS